MSTLTRERGFYSAFYSLTLELHARIWSYLEPLGVSQTAFTHLLYIDSHPGCKISELVDAVHADKAAVTRSLSGLGRLGYVDRQTGKLESRAFVLYLTPAGKAIVEGVAELLRRWETDLETVLGEETYGRILGELEEAREHFLRERVRQAADTAVNAPFSGISYFY